LSTINPGDAEVVKVRLIFAGMLGAFLLLTVFLWRIQVAHGDSYQRDLSRQSVRRIRLPGQRGRIYDRNGRRLADNQPNYCLAIYPEEVRGAKARTFERLHALVGEISTRLGEPPDVTDQDIRRHIRKRLPMPLLAWTHLDDRQLARWAEQVTDLPGVGIYTEATRVYPCGSNACHIIGYVGRADPEPSDNPFHYYVPEMAGRAGVEKQFDDILRGVAGGRLVRVDVAGFRHEDIGVRDPAAGSDLLLSLDSTYQQCIERVLDGHRGAAVVLDPSNGDVLAMASSPGYDLNDFIPAITRKRWKALLENPDKPLLNRAVASQYPPGSTFKPVVALASLENGFSTPETRYHCPGYLDVGRARFKCWYKYGHGDLDLEGALKHSCNGYMYNLGLVCGPEPIVHMAEALGLGRKTGIALPYEARGLVPGPAWKRARYGDDWRDGDTCNLSIGQGALVATPLQMAVVCAALANGGRVFKPRLVLGIRPPKGVIFKTQPPLLVNNMHWDPKHLRAIREGMRDVVNAPDGTGRRAALDDIIVAGKTGTAEYGKKGSGLKYGWMIAFAPYDHPRFAVALVIEQAVSGGRTAAPLIHDLLDCLFHGDHTGEASG